MGNEAYEGFLSRRAIRKFKADAVPKELVEKVIEAGLYAPSGMNWQSPIIVAISNPEVRARLAADNAAIMNAPAGTDPFYGAPTILVVLANRARPTYIYDGSCTMDNMLNAANSLGLGSIWVHRAREVFNTPQWKEWLASIGVEGDYEGIGNCCIGYADIEATAAERNPGRVFWVE